MVHNNSRQIVGVASSVDGVTWACAAVRFDVQNLVEGHMDADFLPMVSPRPSAIQQGGVSITSTIENIKHSDYSYTIKRINKQDWVISFAVIIRR